MAGTLLVVGVTSRFAVGGSFSSFCGGLICHFCSGGPLAVVQCLLSTSDVLVSPLKSVGSSSLRSVVDFSIDVKWWLLVVVHMLHSR